MDPADDPRTNEFVILRDGVPSVAVTNIGYAAPSAVLRWFANRQGIDVSSLTYTVVSSIAYDGPDNGDDRQPT